MNFDAFSSNAEDQIQCKFYKQHDIFGLPHNFVVLVPNPIVKTRT
jgi:hypothetical protein